MFRKASTYMVVEIHNGIVWCWYLGVIFHTILILCTPIYFLIFLNLVLYSKDIYHDEATAFFEYLLKCAFPCDLLGMWICYIYLWYTNARQTAKLLWCFLDSVLKAEFRKRIKTNEHHHWYYIIKSNKSSRWLSNFFRHLEFSISIFN